MTLHVGWDISTATVLIGLMTGLAYGVLAVGLVLVYKATRVINLAYGELGAFGAALLAKLVLDLHWNYFVALVLVMFVGGCLGAIAELIVIRRLFKAPRLVLLVGTIGLAQVFLVLQTVLPETEHGGQFPTPLHRTLAVGDLTLGSAHFMVLAFVPAIAVGLWLFLSRTPFGVAIRAVADNADRAELAAIRSRRVSTAVWALSGVVATLTVALLNPLRGVVVGGAPVVAIGPSLLLRALAAAMFGRMTSLPRALVGGVLVGVVEAVFFANVAQTGLVDVALFVGVLALVLRHGGLRQEEAGSWSLTPKVRAIPDGLRDHWFASHLDHLAGLAGLLLGVGLPLVLTTSSQTFQLTRVLVFALIGLSVTVLTGWTGQLSLGQFAFVGLGAVTATSLVGRGVGFPAAIAYAAVAGALAALVIGFPALRISGPFLAVSTLAFAVAAQTWLLGRSVFLGPGGSAFLHLDRGSVFGVVDLHDDRTYYLLCLGVLSLAVLAVAHLRRTGVGRTVIAVRDNESAAASFSVSPKVVKLGAFAFAGALAGLGGALLAGTMVQFQVSVGSGEPPFGPQQSLQIVAMVVIGGLGSVGGSVLGAVYVVGLPALFGSSLTVSLLVSSIGLLALLLYLPGGLVQVPHRVREALLGRMARGRGAVTAPEARRVRDAPVRPVRPGPSVPAPAPALEVDGVCVSFGGRAALDAIDLEAWPGEVVGLIGSNGAGKSTLMNVISGFLEPKVGDIRAWGVEVTGLPPHARSQLGFGRVFQDARLFGDLTVRETVKVALEGHQRSEFVPSLLALPPSRSAERAKSAEADACIDFLGLGRYADTFVSDLSTGTRRIVELCCLLGQQASLFLLDEPTAGVAQRETEAFGPLIKRIQRELGATVLLIEHDIPLVMSMSDRVYCLAAGRCIAEGSPDAVRSNPAVVAAYLGTDERAIRRSDVASTAVGGSSSDGRVG